MTKEEINKAYNDSIITLGTAHKLRQESEKIKDVKGIEEGIDNAYNKGIITLEIAEELKQQRRILQLTKENAKARFDKNNYTNKAYSKGKLSASDTIAYKTMILLERNRKNTSLIATILSIQFAISILSAIIYLIYIVSQ
jgi:hypothetical protein